MRYIIHIKSLLSVLLLIFALLFSTSIYAKKPVDATPTAKDSLTKSSPSKPEAGIDAQTIDKNSVTQVEQALNGTVAGLYSLRNGGQKFGVSNYNFYVRGKATTGDNTPLILVDGIDGNINLLNPKEIENITILKDPAELAMYGLRGANGVILVTTKRGSSAKNFMDIDAQFGVQSPEFVSKKLSAFEYATLHNEANLNDGANSIYTPDNYKNSTDIYKYPSTQLPDDFLKDYASYKQFNFTAGGGNSVAQYYALVGYMRQDGIFDLPAGQDNLKQTYNERYNFRTNLDVNLGKGFALNTNISAVFDDRRSPWVGSSYNVNASNTYIFNSLFTTPANAYPLLNPDGSLGGTSEYRENPIGLLRSGLRVENTRQLTANVNLTKDLSSLVKGLSVRLQYGFENYNAYYKANYTVFGVSQLQDDGTYALYGANDTKVSTTGGQMSDYYSDMTFNASADYDRTFGKSNIKASVIFNEYSSYASGDVPPYKWLGTSSRIVYSFDNRYFAQFSGSYQGSNSYASGKRFGFFPAGSLGWVVSNEDFFSKNNTLNYLKANLSFGLTGNDRTGGTRFMHRQAYYNTGGYGFGNPNGTSQGSYEGTLGNPDATWEESAQVNAGFDMQLLNRKISASADYFYENRQSILVSQSNITPAIVGIALAQYNAGVVNNAGFEASVKYNDTFGALRVHLGANMMYAKNTIVDLKEIAYPDNETYRYRKGNSVNALFGYEADGIYNEQQAIDEQNVISSFGTLKPGDIKYIDQNEDGIINDADKKVIGDLFPNFIYGINGGFEIKGFDFFFQTEGSEMFDVHIRPDQLSVYAYTNRWTSAQSGAGATYPRLSFASDHNLQTSSYWLQKGSLFRLASMELGYSLPVNAVKKISLSGIRFYAKANNLFSTVNSREGRDLEAPSAGLSQYPSMKTVMLGLTVKL
jgi:TonB-linked SusC/RagA family outer membrane protein